MQLKTFLGTGVVSAAIATIAHPVAAQPIPAIAANACTQRTAEEMVVATRDIEITGAGPVDAAKGTRTLFMRNRVTGQTADCRVNTIDGFVLGVTLTSQQPRPPQTVPQSLINACIQRTAEEMVVAARDIEFVQADAPNPNGTRTLFLRNRVTRQTANCLVNPATNTVISVTVTPAPRPTPPSQGQPVSPNDPVVRSCQATIGRQIRASFSDVQTVTFLSDTTRRFFISNAQEGIRGEGQFAQRSRMTHRFSYNCVVNIRNGTIQNATFSILR
ncbi:MAG: hypothetical protein NW224_06960 [Leptolyngbyaceae cyanobacterium bins.302]|nr:hypothetical protein [Leptolyngbyaceae cyanobacterium bins.302]